MGKIDSKNGIIGLVVGDAMGVPLEFCKREILMKNPIKEMKGFGSHNVPKGSWSDDSSMTIATIDAIIKDKGISYGTIADNFVNWIELARYTPSGKVFGVGRTCLKAISKYESEKAEAQMCGGISEKDNGNGSMMRILPLAYYCYSRNMNEEKIYELVKDVSSITHGHEISIMGCFIYVMYAIKLLNNENLKHAYEEIKQIRYNEYFSKNTINRYKKILENNIKESSLDAINSTGFVVDTLEATLWILLNTNSYNQAIIGAINLGNDTDTIGACVGGLAGIYYGFDNINPAWKKELIKYNYLVDMCDKFNEVLN